MFQGGVSETSTALKRFKRADGVSTGADRHGMSDTLNKYIDSLIAAGKRSVIDERNKTVTEMTDRWNRNVSYLVGKRNTEIDALRRAMPNSQTSFTTGAGLTAGGYGLGRLAALSKHVGKARGGRAGLIGAGLTAAGVTLKDKLLPGQAKLPSVVPSKWVDPTDPSPKTPDPTLFQKVKNLIGLGPNRESRKWVTDKKYPSLIGGGTPKPATPAVPEPKPPDKKPGGLTDRAAALGARWNALRRGSI